MTPVTLYTDFNNADPAGRVRLNTAGSLRDIAGLGAQLLDGMEVTIHDEELAADGEVHFSPAERMWVVQIDWTLVRPWASEPLGARV